MDVWSANPSRALQRAQRYVAGVLEADESTSGGADEAADVPHGAQLAQDLGEVVRGSSGGDSVVDDSRMVVISVNDLAFDRLFEADAAALQLTAQPGSSSGVDDPGGGGGGGRMKHHMTSAWNKIKYGWTWKKESQFDASNPIWLLGRLYHALHDNDRDRQNGGLPSDYLYDEASFREFFTDFISRVWLTYRTSFAPIGDESATSDCGWGCMLRAGQMLVAQALTLHALGRNWTLKSGSTIDDLTHRRIVGYFGDKASAPLSVHRLVGLAGAQHDKAVGDWYGPASVAALIRDAVSSASAQRDSLLCQLCVYVARDCTVYLPDVDQLCGAYRLPDQLPPKHVWQRSLLLLVPLRLGCEKVNVVYASHLQLLFSLPRCVGLIGGKPRHGMYFVGWHKRSLLYLDPHYLQKYVDTDRADFSLKSFHCRWPRKIRFDEIDPSSCVGFYCQTRADLQELMPALAQIVELDASLEGVGSSSGDRRPRHALFSIVNSSQSALHHDAALARPTSQVEPVISHGFELL